MESWRANKDQTEAAKGIINHSSETGRRLRWRIPTASPMMAAKTIVAAMATQRSRRGVSCTGKTRSSTAYSPPAAAVPMPLMSEMVDPVTPTCTGV